MALNKAQLASDLQSIFAEGQSGAKSQAEVAQAIADAIDSYVRGAEVTTTVNVASVSGVTPGGGVSGPGSGTGTGGVS